MRSYTTYPSGTYLDAKPGIIEALGLVEVYIPAFRRGLELLTNVRKHDYVLHGTFDNPMKCIRLFRPQVHRKGECKSEIDEREMRIYKDGELKLTLTN